MTLMQVILKDVGLTMWVM